MNMMTLLFVGALVGVIASLAFGIGAMGRNGTVMHHTSAEWMELRVGFQILAVLAIVVMIVLA